jgi:phosphoglycolate phosphatase
MKKMLLFDVDGTLLLTGGVGKIAFERAFDELFKIKGAWGNLHPDGKTDPLIIDELASRCLKRTLNPKEYETLVHRYLDYFEDELKNAADFHLMPGISELFSEIGTKEDFVIGLATGNLERAGWLKVKRAKLDSHFRFGGFGSDSNDRTELTRLAVKRGQKYAGEEILKEAIYVIGDTPHDTFAAKNLGLKIIAVATGSYSEEDLATHKPYHCLKDLTNVELFLNLLK